MNKLCLNTMTDKIANPSIKTNIVLLLCLIKKEILNSVNLFSKSNFVVI